MTETNCYKLVNRAEGKLLSLVLSTSLATSGRRHAIDYEIGKETRPEADCGRLAVFESAETARRFLDRCGVGKAEIPELYAAYGEDLQKARGGADPADLYLKVDEDRYRRWPNTLLPEGTMTAESVTLIERVPL